MSHFHLTLLFFTDCYYPEGAALVRRQFKILFFFYCRTFSQYIFASALFSFCAQTPINHSQLFWWKFPQRLVQSGKSKLIFAGNLVFSHLRSLWETVEWAEWEPGWSRDRQRSGWNRIRRDAGGMLSVHSSVRTTTSINYQSSWSPNWAHPEQQRAEAIWELWE